MENKAYISMADENPNRAVVLSSCSSENFSVEDLQRVTSSSSLMEDRKEKNAPWLSVPQFGDWDQKGQVPDYSLDFSKIREMRKQNKRDVSRASLGNEEELISSNSTTANSTAHSDHHPEYHQNQHSPSTRRSIFSYFNCCVKA